MNKANSYFTLLLLCVFILNASRLIAQFPNFEDNPTWVVKAGIDNNNVERYREIFFSEQLLIDGERWNVISSSNFGERRAGNFGPIGYAKVEGTKVFFGFFKNQLGFPMYDFSLEVGDSTIMFFPSTRNSGGFRGGKVYVDSISLKDFGGKPKRLIYLRDSSNLDVITPWIDGVGTIEHPFSLFGCTKGSLTGCRYPNTVCLITNEGLIFSKDDSICKEILNAKSIIYVDKNKLNSDLTGRSWNNALPTLQEALEIAEAGDEIWVAEGVYYPAKDMADRRKSFLIPKGVKIYGGFRGEESNLSDRNLDEPLTILSGNIGKHSDSTDNSLHVVTLLNPDSKTIIDGFTIRDGFAQESNNNLADISGGGIQVIHNQTDPEGWPLIRNCTLRNNVAGLGGGIYFRTIRSISASFRLENCYFENNKAITFGGGIYKEGQTSEGETDFMESCTFDNNEAIYGGAIALVESANETYIRNCSFTQNFGRSGSGGIEIRKTNGKASYIIEECNFIDNSAREGGAIGAFPVNSQTDFLIKSCTFFKNKPANGFGSGACAFYNSGGHMNLVIDNTLFEKNVGTSGGLNMSDSGMSDGGGISVSLLTVKNSTFIDNSKAIDYQSPEPGNRHEARIVNTLFIGQKMGAYEIEHSHQSRTYFNNCTFVNNGSFTIRKNWSTKFSSSEFWNEVYISNSIIYEPQLTFIDQILPNRSIFYNRILKYYFVSHSLFSVSDCIAFGHSVNLCGNGNLFGLSPQFVDAATGDYSLKACSPGVNAGVRDSIFQASASAVDLKGDPRIMEGIPDMGAYEQKALNFELEMVKLPNCAFSQDGAIQFNVSEKDPYQIEWKDSLTKESYIGGLGAGAYEFILSTAQDCRDTLFYELTAPSPLEVDYTLLPARSAESQDGVVVINRVGGGTAPYRFDVRKNDTLLALYNLLPGDYELLVTDQLGCEYKEPITISFTTSTNAAVAATDILIAPNPVQKGQTMQITGRGTALAFTEWAVIDVLGQVVATGTRNAHNNTPLRIDTRALNTGLYVLRLSSSHTIMQVIKFVVE